MICMEQGPDVHQECSVPGCKGDHRHICTEGAHCGEHCECTCVRCPIWRIDNRYERHGHMNERHQIVKWLRSIDRMEHTLSLARRIENGEHLRGYQQQEGSGEDPWKPK